MRLSVIEGDPGYDPYQKLGNRRERVRIFIDGVEQQHVLTADSELGFIDAYETGEDGLVLINLEKSEFYEKRLFGNVEIRIG